jgi:hemerythrin
MATLKWSDELEVDVFEIDIQHKRLIDMLDDLEFAIHENKEKYTIGKIVAGISAYTKTVFATEEKYFDKFEYPESESHKSEHSDFIAKVAVFEENFKSGKIEQTVEDMQFLSDWLQNHIVNSDKKFVPLFHEMGLH